MVQPNLRDHEMELDARIDQADIPNVYGRIARVYDMWGRLTESRAVARAIELAAIEDGQSILEVAVGTGVAFREILKRNPHGRNLGIDLSPAMLARAKARMRDLSGVDYRLEIGTAFDLPARSESVDILFNSYMFDLIPYADMNRILDEFTRVLKPEGALLAFFGTSQPRDAHYTRYIIVDDVNLKHRPYPATRGRLATLANRDIIRLFERLRVSDSFLLQNNLREILFRKPAYETR